MPTLPVPFHAQRSPTYCGLAVLEMVLGYKLPGRRKHALAALVWGSVQRARRDLHVDVNPLEGVSPAAIGTLMALLDIAAFQYTYPKAQLSFADIRKFIDGGSPILAYLQLGLAGAYGHFLLIIGYGTDASAGNREYIVLHDPSGEASKAVYYDRFPQDYFTTGAWIWGESWVLSWPE